MGLLRVLCVCVFHLCTLFLLLVLQKGEISSLNRIYDIRNHFLLVFKRNVSLTVAIKFPVDTHIS